MRKGDYEKYLWYRMGQFLWDNYIPDEEWWNDVDEQCDDIPDIEDHQKVMHRIFEKIESRSGRAVGHCLEKERCTQNSICKCLRLSSGENEK